MSEMHDEVPIKTGQIVAASALIVFALAAAATARLTGIGVAKREAVAVARAHDYRFVSSADGSLAIYPATGTEQIGRLGPEHHGFVRVVMKGLERERMIRDVPAASPIRLVELTDGRRLVEDPATGFTVALRAFGAGNAVAFEELFALGSKSQ